MDREKTDLERLADSIIQCDWSISDPTVFRMTVIGFARKYLSPEIKAYVEEKREQDAARHAKLFDVLRETFSEQADRKVRGATGAVGGVGAPYDSTRDRYDGR